MALRRTGRALTRTEASSLMIVCRDPVVSQRPGRSDRRADWTSVWSGGASVSVWETAGVSARGNGRTEIGAARRGVPRPTLAVDPGADDEEDDKVLVGRVAAHDAGAFRTLVERHLPSLLGVARRMLGDAAEAEDVSQEALIRLWQNGANLQLGAGGVRPWLRRVVTNLCIDRIRAGRRTDVMEEVPDRSVEPDQLAALEAGDLAARVDAALQSLPERQRIALSLFHYEGLSQIEVGEILGVSDEAVESLLARARRTMRRLLDNEWRQLAPGKT